MLGFALGTNSNPLGLISFDAEFLNELGGVNGSPSYFTFITGTAGVMGRIMSGGIVPMITLFLTGGAYGIISTILLLIEYNLILTKITRLIQILLIVAFGLINTEFVTLRAGDWWI